MVYYTGNIISFLIPPVLTMILILKYKISFKSTALTAVLCVVSVWFFAQYIKYGDLNISLTFYLYYGIIIAFIHIRIYGRNIIYLYEDIVSHLSFISIIGWIIQIISPKIIHTLMLFPSNAGTIAGSCLLYSEGRDYETSLFFFRNAGFSWEPGMFASLVIVALFFNGIINNFSIKNNNKLYVLFIALITTQSTTGYGTLLFISCLIFLYNYKDKYKVLILIVMIPMAICIYSLPFMGNKIEDLWVDNIEETKDRIDNAQNYYDELRALTRFEALAMETYNIQNDPILGYGRDSANSYIEKNLELSVGLPNGLLKVFAKYGCILGLFFYACLFNYSKWLSKEFKYKGKFLFFIVYCMISVSYSFIEVPIFMTFWLMPILIKRKIEI